MTLARCLAEGAAAGRRAAEDARLRWRARGGAEGRRRAVRGDAALACRGLETESLRRPAERRHRRRHRARRARGLPLGRAPQALHHARHGDRPGQDRQRQRPRHHGGADRPLDPRDRHDHASGRPYTPVAIGALAGHHRGKHFRPTRLTPSHAWAQEQGAVFVETGPWLRAQYYPRPGESDWLATVNREVQHRPRGGRLLRRLDARQDRRAGPGRRRVPRSALHQHVLDACRSAACATA